jgi:AraC family transcriptional regulator
MASKFSGAPRTLSGGFWSGVELRVKEQDISTLTTWSIAGDRHVVVVHLDGPIDRLETELPGTGAVHDPPMPGEVWVIPAGVRYASLARGAVVRYAELFLDAQPDTVPRAVAARYDHLLYRGVLRLEQLVRQRNDVARLAAQSLSAALRGGFEREYTLCPSQPRSRPRLDVREKRLLEQWLEGHLGDEIRLERLAELVRMKPHDFLIAFRSSFGTTPAQHVIDQRLRRARWLLRSTRTDITRIAMETGFASHGHLTTTFRNRLGVTPRDFRELASPRVTPAH